MWRRVQFVWVLFGLVIVASPVRAEHRCREVARDVARQVNGLAASDAGTTSEYERLFITALDRNPDCQAELSQLVTYFNAGGQREFPFPADEDPVHGFLGPVGWWWNTVYVSMFNRSTWLMVLFGWEVLLLPVPFLIAICSGFIGLFNRPAHAR